MPSNESTARIKNNNLLESTGWIFFLKGSNPASIRLESSIIIKSTDLDALGDNFENISNGYIDFLLKPPPNEFVSERKQ